MGNSNTPYDDAFRTLLTDCSRLIIPLVNLMFDTDYHMDETVTLFQNESFITEGDDSKRITDSNFSIGSNINKRYNIECQSNSDGSIIIRVFEYATQIAISTATTNGDTTVFELPRTGILYLRSTNNTKKHKILVKAPNGECLSYTIPVVKVKDYTMEQILSEGLWFLIPFYFFRYNLKELDASTDKIEAMKAFYTELWQRLEGYVDKGKITEFEKCSIKAMCDKVAEALALNFDNVQKGIGDIMGGQILEYEAKRIAREAAEQARKEAEEKARKDIEKERRETKEARRETKESNLFAIKNMISFGVPKDKILSKYSSELYEEALKLIEEDEKSLKEN